MTFSARIPKGTSTLIYGKAADREKFIASLARDDKDVVVTETIEVAKKKRSFSQNAFYFLVINDFVRPALIDLGWEEEETTSESIHEMFKALFNYKERIIEATGEIIRQPLTTTGLSTSDFMIFMENIKRWCAQNLDIVIPEPDSQLRLEIDKNQ